MNWFSVVPLQFSEWGWLFGFAVVSLALVALAVLADALYEGYREKMRQHQEAAAHRGDHSEPGEKPKRAA
jgi:hypothetical protein